MPVERSNVSSKKKTTGYLRTPRVARLHHISRCQNLTPIEITAPARSMFVPLHPLYAPHPHPLPSPNTGCMRCCFYA
jgi:hypothetical protein